MTRTWAILAGVLLLAWPVAAQQERLAEIRVHGNYHTPDAEVIRLSGLSIGDAVTPDTVREVREKLERSGRFVSAEVRKRYRSLDLSGDVALVIVVQEYPTPESVPDVGEGGGAASPAGLFGRTFRGAMFMPVLGYADGYGLTYGARVSFVDGFGKGGRLSVPLTWGASKRAAAEFEKSISNGPIDRVAASASLSRQTNPHYEIDDDRREATVSASRQLGAMRAGAHLGIHAVSFGGLDARFAAFGADLTLDTRADPAFPRNAVFVSAGWERLELQAAPVNRVRLEGRGYAGLIGQSVVSVRALFARADRPLPPFERFLLGGADTLRGYRAGTFAGDAIAAASVELRVPFSSPLSFARTGIDVFTDVGTAIDGGTSFRAATWHPGFGGGVFLLASVFQINADVAARPGGHLRVHLTSGFRF